MPGTLLECIRQAVVAKATAPMVRYAPLGESVCDVAQAAMDEWLRQRPEPEKRRAALEALARASEDKAQQLAQSVATGPGPYPLREPLTAYLLIPAFFIYSGLNTQLSLILDGPTLLMAAVVLVVSFVAKFGAVGLAARWQGMSWYEAGSMGALANARGLMELILLNIGFEAGLISGKLYTILALMTIVTTLVATPLQRMFGRRLERAGSKFGPDGVERREVLPSASGS